MKKYFFLLYYILIGLLSVQATNSEMDSLLRRLDTAFEERPLLIEMKKVRLRELKSHYSNSLSDEERSYLSKTGTHADFLIYRSIGKEPVCAIEVDGFNYHKKGSQQYERDQLKNSIFGKYKLPLLRFSTNGSGEEQTIKAFLRSYVSS